MAGSTPIPRRPLRRSGRKRRRQPLERALAGPPAAASYPGFAEPRGDARLSRFLTGSAAVHAAAVGLLALLAHLPPEADPRVLRLRLLEDPPLAAREAPAPEPVVERPPPAVPPAAPRPAPPAAKPAPPAPPPEPAPRPQIDRVAPGPEAPTPAAAARRPAWRDPAKAPAPDLAIDRLAVPAAPRPLPAARGRASRARPSARATASRPALPARPAAPRPAVAPAPAPAVARAPTRPRERTAKRPAPAPAAAPRAPGGRSRIPGVSLGSLAPCVSDTRETALKQQVAASAGKRASCESPAGRFHFLETKNVNAFLMGIERAPGRRSGDRCEELAHALDCLSHASRRSRR